MTRVLNVTGEPRLTTKGARHHLRAFVVLIAVVLLAAACSSGSGGSSKSATRTSASKSSTTAPAPTTTTTTEQPGWTPVSYGPSGIAVDRRSYVAADGSQITIVRFRAGQVHFDLHVGSQDPPVGNATIGPNAGPAISAAEQPILLAAFNGGFQMSTNSGGFEVNNQVLSPLVNGLASFVINSDGTGHIGIWGQTIPTRGEAVTSVRQNLAPLVINGQPSPAIANISAWGATLGPAPAVARSALGEDAQGNIIYAASMSALPVDLASALISAGAVTAMELDINPYWVQLALASTPGGPLSIGVPGQERPADQYQVGWTRDFITVLSGG
ncbi:MAG: hypothetical protein ACYDEP_01185 [Acidimicrobiales bacterium]